MSDTPTAPTASSAIPAYNATLAAIELLSKDVTGACNPNGFGEAFSGLATVVNTLRPIVLDEEKQQRAATVVDDLAANRFGRYM